jgi:hypothetical protein
VCVTLPYLTAQNRADALRYKGHDAAVEEEVRMPHPNGMPTLHELRTMSDDELVTNIDQHLGLTPDGRHLALMQWYYGELQRHEQETSREVMRGYTREMTRFTKQVRDMTAVIVIATCVNLVLAVMMLFQ